jgi:hypothetical protein
MGRHRGEEHSGLIEIVKDLAAQGFSGEEIAKFTGLRSVESLRRSFGREIDKAAIDAHLNVAKSLFQMAVSGKNATATIFWLRCRAGWNVNPSRAEAEEEIEMVFGPYPEVEE